MIVTVARFARDITTSSFADITAKACTSAGWDENEARRLVVFTVNLSDDETKMVRIRCLTPDSTTETLLRQMWTAYQGNDTYLALASPTTAQAVAQVAALTRQVQGVFRALAPLDS